MGARFIQQPHVERELARASPSATMLQGCCCFDVGISQSSSSCMLGNVTDQSSSFVICSRITSGLGFYFAREVCLHQSGLNSTANKHLRSVLFIAFFVGKSLLALSN